MPQYLLRLRKTSCLLKDCSLAMSEGSNRVLSKTSATWLLMPPWKSLMEALSIRRAPLSIGAGSQAQGSGKGSTLFSGPLCPYPLTPFFVQGRRARFLVTGLAQKKEEEVWMEQKGACSKKGKVVCSDQLSLVSFSPAGTLLSPVGLIFTSSVYPYLLRKEFLRRGSLLQYSLGCRDHQKGPQMIELG